MSLIAASWLPPSYSHNAISSTKCLPSILSFLLLQKFFFEPITIASRNITKEHVGRSPSHRRLPVVLWRGLMPERSPEGQWKWQRRVWETIGGIGTSWRRGQSTDFDNFHLQANDLVAPVKKKYQPKKETCYVIRNALGLFTSKETVDPKKKDQAQSCPV